MQNLHIALLQANLIWQDRDANLERLSLLMDGLKSSPDLIVLPEMFTSGFTMEAEKVAEELEGETLDRLQKQAAARDVVITGSFVTHSAGEFYNRLYWIRPDGSFEVYDKRHLFRMAGEHKHYTAGNHKIIVSLGGWRIMPLICYDLRFPVWSRNTLDSEGKGGYDCLLYVANWPAARSEAWAALLKARAIENLSYCVGVNRTGTDGLGIAYNGRSAIISPKGEQVCELNEQEQVFEGVLEAQELLRLREKFPAYADADRFSIERKES